MGSSCTGRRQGDSWARVQGVRKSLVVASWALTYAHPKCQAQASHICSEGEGTQQTPAHKAPLPDPEPWKEAPAGTRGTDCECRSSQGDSLSRPAEGPSGPRQLTPHVASGTPRRPPGTPGRRRDVSAGSLPILPAIPGLAQGLPPALSLTCRWAGGDVLGCS